MHSSSLLEVSSRWGARVCRVCLPHTASVLLMLSLLLQGNFNSKRGAAAVADRFPDTRFTAVFCDYFRWVSGEDQARIGLVSLAWYGYVSITRSKDVVVMLHCPASLLLVITRLVGDNIGPGRRSYPGG